MKYVVQRMTERDYNCYMCGGYGYDVEALVIEAETREEAAAKAEADGYVVNKRSVLTVEENDARFKAECARIAALEARDAAAKEKRKATEARKAAEAGLTVEEYRKAKARKAKVTRLEREVAELRKALAAKEKELEALI